MKEWIANIFRQPDEQRFPVVWPTEQCSAFNWLAQWSEETGVLPEAAQTLPDEPAFRQDEETLRWAPGALDGAFGHHIAQGNEKEKAAEVMQAIINVLRRSSSKNMQALYQLAKQETPLNFIDNLLAMMATSEALDARRLRALVVFLVTRSPDRQVVKLAMALLAFFPYQQSINLLRTLGSHDEFTLYAVVAMRAILPPEEFALEWLALAKRTAGWGRIQLIERLPEAPNETVRQWLLREGYSNGVMVEYTAWHCAEHGRLHEALDGEVDAELLKGAAEILRGMIVGQPGPDMRAYSFAALACERYLAHIVPGTTADLLHYEVAGEIGRLAREEEFADEAERQRLIAQCEHIQALPAWPALIEAGLRDDDDMIFHTALQLCRAQGGDPWPTLYQRHREQPERDLWYQLMQTDNPDYIAKVIALAEKELDLAAIASGPQKSLGLGPQYRQHSALDFILQDLHRFPGQGWRLIRTGLKSPVTRNRHMALNALEAWPQALLPAETLALLENAQCAEPEDAVQERLAQLLAQWAEKP
ncbi:MAG TPA: hypothetical protein DEF05_13330 [Erwinia sp.]|uniref:hypothetical protein n=1 Tax=Erwinia citreus TaxID=558 RepID=UPI000E9755C4|nr:hypothetical protein [Erwinia sp.]HBV40625.1 hypothetical protein [Erwinia sp.]